MPLQKRRVSLTLFLHGYTTIDGRRANPGRIRVVAITERREHGRGSSRQHADQRLFQTACTYRLEVRTLAEFRLDMATHSRSNCKCRVEVSGRLRGLGDATRWFSNRVHPFYCDECRRTNKCCKYGTGRALFASIPFDASRELLQLSRSSGA